ncbi:STAS domain-containing protein [Streptomyces sp. NPDC053431]|uniref:STAS domain-containing protein n=1 Tax=Streptomyces sp. NPDC053431 TaxID=3365703 RepID=UPI0037D31370
MTSETELVPHPEPERPADDSAGDPFVVRVIGDMDLDHSAGLRSALLRAAHEAPEGAAIVVDLQYSSFCDSTGLNVLLAARGQALESGHTLQLAAPSHQMVRLLETTGSIELFDLRPAVPPPGPPSRNGD